MSEAGSIIAMDDARLRRARPAAAPERLLRRSAQPAALALEADVLRDAAAVDAIAAEWRALEHEAGGAIGFQSLDWCRAVIAFETGRGNLSFDPVIVTIRRYGRLVALLPLERVATKLRRALVPLGDGFAQYSEIILASGEDPAAAVKAMLAAATRVAPADVVRFLKVRADSALARGLPRGALPLGRPEASAAIRLTDYPDFDTYYATRKAKTRKNFRNARNRLERTAPLSHLVAADGEAKLGVIRRTLAGRAERLEGQGLTSRAFATAAFEDFCASLASGPGEGAPQLLATSLLHGDTPIAEQWGLVHNDRYYAYVASRDFSNSDESPGKLHLGEIMQTCAARGIGTVDLMVPAMPYKLTWATEVIAVTDYALPLTRRGGLTVRLWDRRLRPGAKALALSLPVKVRSALLRLARPRRRPDCDC